MDDKKTIVIIDDEVELTEILKSYIEERRPNYEVLTAFDGEEGLKLLNKTTPDLLILDINLPKIGGIELYNRLADKDGKTKFPVLIFTVRGELGDFFDNINVDGFISKPFNMKHLVGEVDRVIHKKGKPVVFLLDSKTKPYIKDTTYSLRRLGYKILIIENLDMFRTAINTDIPDAVIMEYEQKATPGNEIIKSIKDVLSKDNVVSSKYYVPIIVYSYSGTDYKQKSMDAGADMYIGKPESFESVDFALKEVRVKIEEERESKIAKEMTELNKEITNTPQPDDMDFFKF